MKKYPVLAGLIFLVLICYFFVPQARVAKEYVVLKIKGKKTVSDRVAEFGPAVEARLTPHFQSSGVPFPPKMVAFLVFKNEKLFEIYAPTSAGEWKEVCSYPILAASGNIGPKLKEGDRQVPEGIYGVESLNPNSLFHLSVKVDYPNALDKMNAQNDRRNNLGGDIMIHGNQLSIGCIALGDPASEDVFVLTSKVGKENVKVIISPIDFRKAELPSSTSTLPDWTDSLYQGIKNELSQYQ